MVYQIGTLQRADNRILRHIYALYAPTVLRWIIQHGGTREDAADTFQSALAVLYEQAHAQHDASDTELSTVLLPLCQRIWRGRHGDKKTIPLSEELPAGGWDEAIEEEERHLLFRRYFQQLDGPCQLSLSLLFDGVPMDFICTQMGHPQVSHTLRHQDNCKKTLMNYIRQHREYQQFTA